MPNQHKKHQTNKINLSPSATPFLSQSERAEELVNQYGTYNIQPTADSDHKYPTIAQGLPRNPEQDEKAK